MKAQAEATEILTILGITVVGALILFFIMPIIKNILEASVFSSPQIISRDLANLITISASSTDDIIIYYKPSPQLTTYRVNLKDRYIFVETSGKTEKSKDSTNSFAVDTDGFLENANSFEIKMEVNNIEKVVKVESS